MLMNAQEFSDLLELESKKAGGYKKLADKLGVTEEYIYMIRNGTRKPGPSVLKPLGFEKVILYKYVGYSNNGK